MKRPLQVVDKNRFRINDFVRFLTSDDDEDMHSGVIVQLNRTTVDISEDDYDEKLDDIVQIIYRVSVRYVESRRDANGNEIEDYDDYEYVDTIWYQEL